MENLEQNGNLSKDEARLANDFFEKYVKNEIIFDELLNEIGAEKYEKLVRAIKEKHKDFYAIQKILMSNPKKLVNAFVECSIRFNSKTFEGYSKLYTKDTMLNVLQVFDRIKYFCIDNNYSKETFESILIDYYNCQKEIAKEIAIIFEENRLYILMYKILKTQSK